LLGAKGSAKPETIAELANATITEDFQGIMAWYSTVSGQYLRLTLL
jgi:hypothetical protein